MAIALNASGDHVDDIEGELAALRAVFARPGWTAAEAAVTDENGTSRVSLMPAPGTPAASTARGSAGAPVEGDVGAVDDPTAAFGADPTGI